MIITGLRPGQPEYRAQDPVAKGPNMKRISFALVTALALTAVLSLAAYAGGPACTAKASQAKAGEKTACTAADKAACAAAGKDGCTAAMAASCTAADKAACEAAMAEAKADMHECCAAALAEGKGCCGKDAAALKADFDKKVAAAEKKVAAAETSQKTEEKDTANM